MTEPAGGDRLRLGSITAWAEMGSAVSRNPAGRRHLVRLAGPGRSVIVAGGLSESGAHRVAEVINEFLAEILHAGLLEPATCARCAMAMGTE